jgi:uncharacterized membrane protein
VAEVAEVWQNHFAEEGVSLSMVEEFAQAMADVEMGVSYCPPGIDWAAVIDEMWGREP